MGSLDSLDVRQQDALVAFLRALADGELSVEEARCRLCEDRGFDAYEVFRGLQGGRRSRTGWINAYDLHAWLAEQPHGLAAMSLEDVAAMLSPHADQLGELRYEDFLRFVLPTHADHAWLRDIALTRCSQGSWRQHDADNSHMPPDVAYRFCQLLEREMDMCRRLKFHRKTLRELIVHKDTILKFLDSEQGVCAGMGGLLSPAAVRCVLTERLQALTRPQCVALLRRINPGDTCLAAFDTLAKYLAPQPPPLESLLPTGGLGSSTGGNSAPSRPQLECPGLSVDGKGRCCASPRPRSPPRESTLQAQGTDTFGHPDGFGAALRTARTSPPPPLQEPLGPQGCCSPRLRRVPSPARDGGPRTPAWRATAGVGGLPAGVRRAAATNADLDSASATPPPAFASPVRWEAFGKGLLPQRSWASFREGATSGSGVAPGNPGIGSSWEFEVGRDTSPLPRGRRANPQRYAALPRERSWAAWERGGRELQRTPERRSCALDSTRAPTTEHSRSSPPWELPSASQHSVPWSPPPPLRRPSPLRGSSSPQRSTSLPPQALGGGSPSPWGVAQASAAEPALPLAPDAMRPREARGRERQARMVLQTLARQAELDAQVEDCKVLVPKSCPLEAIFVLLDRSRKGYLSDMDLWQFDQDFGGPTPFGSFCSLVCEVRMRRPQQDDFAIPGRLNLRDIGILVFPVGSQEHEAMCAAKSDGEAKSILYLLSHSEPCPTCGMRVQRSADSAGCPNVTCPVCGTSFRCFCVVGDSRSSTPEEELLPAASRYQLHRLVSTSAHAADELERDRKKLAHVLAVDMCALSDVFSIIAGGRLSFSPSDLRRAFYQQGVLPAEHELSLLWHRYARHGSTAVTFPDFARQLQPCSVGKSS